MRFCGGLPSGAPEVQFTPASIGVWVITGVLATLAVASAGVLALTSSPQFQSKIPGRAIDVAAVLANSSLRKKRK